MAKITFMGAGSTVFAKNILGDCMCREALKDSHIALYDINKERLVESEKVLATLNKNINDDRATITTYLGDSNRKKALAGADFVVNAIQVGGYEPCTVTDFEIPKKYGLRQTIADTLGTGGAASGHRSVLIHIHHARFSHGEYGCLIFIGDAEPHDQSHENAQRNQPPHQFAVLPHVRPPLGMYLFDFNLHPYPLNRCKSSVFFAIPVTRPPEKAFLNLS